jgi:uncharacterized protein
MTTKHNAGLNAFFLTFCIGATGGLAFVILGFPLPWMLGSLTATAAASIMRARWQMPSLARNVARPVVGILAGSAFTPQVAASIGEWWPVVVYVAGYTIAVSTLGYMFFRRVASLDRVTALFASTPAGLSELSMLGGSLGADVRALVIVHAVRVLVVVTILPFALQLIVGEPVGRSMDVLARAGGIELSDWLVMGACGVAGFAIGTYTRFPGGSMVAALFLSAILHGAGWMDAAPPAWLVVIVQIVVGAVLGGRFGGIEWRTARGATLHALVWAAILTGLFGASAGLGAWLFERTLPVMLLALAPGGMLEVTVMTYALGIEVAFVMTCQVLRSLLILGIAPAILKKLALAKP